MNRRTFLKIAGIGSVSIAAGCTSEPEKTLYALVQAPDDMVTGNAAWYASTCRECPAGCGIHAKNREGRVIKIEGNPRHPVNRGKVCMRGQAALQAVYNPDRIKTPQLKVDNQWRSISFLEALSLLKAKTESAARRGPGRISMLSENVGDCLFSLLAKALGAWKSGPPVIFEPLAYESLKKSNRLAFGIESLPSYRMDRSDFLLSFGADFLETWLSPVEYARKFKAMHQAKAGRKNLFCHVGPFQSLTGANADEWIPCRPGGEAALALGLVHELLMLGRGRTLSQPLRSEIHRAAAPYARERVLTDAGIRADVYERLLARLKNANRPLILGTGSGAPRENSLQTNVAANLMNRVLDPELELFDFDRRHAVERAAYGSALIELFEDLAAGKGDVLLLNNVNPLYTHSSNPRLKEIFAQKSFYMVSFANFMDETSAHADLILPVALPLESWDEYSGRRGTLSTLQPAMPSLTSAPQLGDVMMQAAFDPRHTGRPAADYKTYLYNFLAEGGRIRNTTDWVRLLGTGGHFALTTADPIPRETPDTISLKPVLACLQELKPTTTSELTFMAAPSLRFFDGRGANRPWLCEIPDPLTQVAWQTPLRINPRTAAALKLESGDVVRIKSRWGSLEAPVYESFDAAPGVLVMDMGQGHAAYGRYARGMGRNPFDVLPPEIDADSRGPLFYLKTVSLEKTGRRMPLAHTDGSRFQQGRNIARSIRLADLDRQRPDSKSGLTLENFPLVLPLPQGYDSSRDVYPPHEHAHYRWSMTVDLDRCIGCGACAAACYAENNLGVVGLEQVLRGREMAWIRVERYLDPDRPEKVAFLPMMCQHCDNAPCESVCPVYAPHHSKEGLNNQIYNRCIGTRFCSQNCPYKVRRFNWYSWQRPDPLSLQLNPEVTARSKGVMEKCSFCIQRIKQAHNTAKNENRKIRDGEVQPACLQACPTEALAFGNIMDPNSRVRRLFSDPRAYQVLGYLNTKPAVIYLKKVTAEG